MSVSTLPRPIVPRISIPATPLPGIPAGVSASLQRSDSTLNSIGADLTSETSGLKLASADAPVCPIAAPAMSALSAAFSAANRLGDPTISPPAGTKDSLAGDTTLRVNVALLELLMNLAGELVLGRNQLNDAIARSDLDAIRLGGQRVGAVTSELQQTIMQTRLQPIGNVFNKFPRMVRDLCRGADKEIQLEVSGKEVETDKTIVEGLADPLVHMVRNAVDHGIEPVQERARLNKHPIGKVTLRASHEAGQVVVEVGDDGRGINPQRIAAGAIQRGLITAEQARSMSDNELLSLIFQPGMSTAANVTELSGRGVGMDVVKTNIDRLGGKVEIESQPGKGTIFRIKLPLTLAIIPSLLVAVAGERFAIPQDNVGELLCVPAAQIKDRVEVVGGAEVLRLRGELIPVVNLSQVLGMDRWYHDPRSGNRCKERRSRIADRRSRRHPADSTAVSTAQNACQTTEPRTGEDRRYHAASDRNIVVVAAGTLRYGLVVDELHDTMEIVVKPLGRHLQRLREYAGATILGDGKIALILDANGLATKARISSMAATARARQLAQEAQRATLQDTVALLIFFNAADEPCGVPLADVARVEHVLVDQIESLGGRRSMRHRGRTLPLVTLQDVAQVGCLGPEQARVVLVFEAAGRQVGLLAAMPIDAVDAAVVIDRDTLRQKGVLGSAVVEGRTTLIVDLCEVVEATYPDWIKEPTAAPLASSQAPTILLAEDSDFFRSQVCKSIEAEGYRVLAVEDGQAAWDMLAEQGQSVRLVVTDVEMPRLGGLELTARIRADRRFAQLPVVALSSLAGEDDMARGTAAGVSEYLVKLDRQKLIEAIGRLLGQETDAQP
jgi:two-component system chemotaxis sensor kinase CheA